MSEKVTKTLFQKYCDYFNVDTNHFKGVTLSELNDLEELFDLNIFVYELQCNDAVDAPTATLIQRSSKVFHDTMNLNLCHKHFSYIFDFSLYSRSFECVKCRKMWHTKFELERHEKN